MDKEVSVGKGNDVLSSASWPPRPRVARYGFEVLESERCRRELGDRQRHRTLSRVAAFAHRFRDLPWVDADQP
jgi:hypothetical protein